jgi:hypothetical protein
MEEPVSPLVNGIVRWANGMEKAWEDSQLVPTVVPGKRGGTARADARQGIPAAVQVDGEDRMWASSWELSERIATAIPVKTSDSFQGRRGRSSS